jgi:hypothetical protein
VLQRLAASFALMFSIYGVACAGPVFSFDGTPGKLPKAVVPIHYAVEITPDIASLALPGVEIIDIEVRAPTARLTLNAVNTTVAVASVDDDTARTGSASNFRRRLTNSTSASSSSIIRPNRA